MIENKRLKQDEGVIFTSLRTREQKCKELEDKCNELEKDVEQKVERIANHQSELKVALENVIASLTVGTDVSSYVYK